VAKALLLSSGEMVDLVEVNIEDELKLLDRYSVRIPVLQREDNGAELFWPFDESALAGFLKGPA
jgi:hypothetical protein